MCVLEIPEGALANCVRFSVKCSIGFCGFPQDLSPTIKIHLIFIAPSCCCAFPNSLFCPLPTFTSLPFIILHLFPRHRHRRCYRSPYRLPLPAVSLALSLSLPAWFIDARPVLSLSFCLAVRFSPPPCFIILNLSRASIFVCQREETSIFRAESDVT